ncbi:transketolase [Parafilimonas sp.]|uniref:transketolase n=1 Tax=Parafilimonas sp. TaxID=1969739 RepID=UPI003F802DAC
MNADLTKLSIDTVRLLAADAVQKANSGHPGTPMATAPMGYVLWTKAMNYNAKNPEWANRDRFILSAGHACMLQYAYLYLTGYDLTLDDLKNFRQLHSKTAGHPEYGLLPGIEITTGPLGQGFANGVGMAIAQKYLAARYNKEGFHLFDYNIYAICSDGDLMEGVSAEAASIAGHLKLGNIIYLYDNNHISIEGDTSLAFDEDVAKRFEAYGWHTQSVADGNDVEGIAAAIEAAKKVTDKPSLILVRTHIAYGAPNAVDTAESHGAPLGKEELALTKKNLGFDPEQSFVVADEVLGFYRKAGSKGADTEKKWNELFAAYKEKYPELAAEYELFSNGKLPEGWKEKLPVFGPDDAMATRQASGKTINAIADFFPLMIGGAADLAPSTNTLIKNASSFEAGNYGGKNFHFGIREHAMGAILNGMAVTKGFTPYGATFLIFSEYMRPPIRLAAIMQLKPIYVYTHDSIGLGEDGTTHQPVEQLASLRSIPNITVMRPGDPNETAQAWRVALEHIGGPVAIILSRQKLPSLDQSKYAKASNLEKGAYVLSDAENAQLILIATGSEVSLAVKAQAALKEEGIAAKVVSMPSWELFEKQDAAYKETVFPKSLRKRIAIEAGSPMGWHKYVTDEGDVVGISKFGESAPGDVVMREYGFTVENVVKKAKELLK